jgi:GDP-D-mannose dehydratase
MKKAPAAIITVGAPAGRRKLAWRRRTTLEELCQMMVKVDGFSF